MAHHHDPSARFFGFQATRDERSVQEPQRWNCWVTGPGSSRGNGWEWMGCWGLLGWLIVGQWIIPEHSLRLAPVSQNTNLPGHLPSSGVKSPAGILWVHPSEFRIHSVWWGELTHTIPAFFHQGRRGSDPRSHMCYGSKIEDLGDHSFDLLPWTNRQPQKMPQAEKNYAKIPKAFRDFGLCCYSK